MPGFVSDQLVGLVVPMGTPQSIIGKLAAALNESLADPTVKSRIIEVGAIPEASTPEQYGKMIADDQKRWGDIVRKLALTAE
jgi:tripartite-type tricarboxylate transporter receptor subunit TctC